MTLFDALHDSHEIQRSLCRRLTRTKHADAREPLFLQLKVELAAHAAAEERYLYVPLLMTDAGLNASRHALSEHHDIDELCEDLSVREKGGVEWGETMAQLSHQVHHHLKEEESKFFKVGGRILSETKKETLRRQYLKDLARMRRLGVAEFKTLGLDGAGLVASV